MIKKSFRHAVSRKIPPLHKKEIVLVRCSLDILMIHVVAKSTHVNPKVSNVTHPRTLAWRDNHITADTYAFASPPAAATAACTAAMQPSPAISTPTHIALLAAEMIAAFEHFWSKSFAFCAVCGMPRLAAFARESGHGLVASKRICYQKICVFGCNGQQMVTHL